MVNYGKNNTFNLFKNNINNQKNNQLIILV